MYLFQAETHITLCGCTWFLCATDWFIYRSLTLYSRTGLQVMSCCHCYFSTEHFPHCSHFPAWITFQNEFLFWLWTSSRKKWDFCTIMKAKDSGLFVHRIFFFFLNVPFQFWICLLNKNSFTLLRSWPSYYLDFGQDGEKLSCSAISREQSVKLLKVIRKNKLNICTQTRCGN